MTTEWALACMIVIVVVIVLIAVVGFIVAEVLNERRRQRDAEDNKDKSLVATLQAMHLTMQTVCERVQSRVDVERDNHSQVLGEIRAISSLSLDIERRVTQQIEETRSIIRSPRRDGTGTRIDIKGSHVNQAGGEINNNE